MGDVYPYYPAKLVIGILISKIKNQIQMENDLVAEFGKIDYKSELINFKYSSFYNKEMGTPIQKYFLSFKKLHSPEHIVKIKLITNKIEKKYCLNEYRTINLDPGHMFLSKFILSTTKDGSHRIPLHSGIYGEITLLFEKKSFRPVEWTYPDFTDENYLRILNEIRQIYKPQLKQEFDLTIYSKK